MSVKVGFGPPRVQAIGRSRGGPTTKIHALSDHAGRPLAFHLTGDNVSDFTGAEALLPTIPVNSILHGDKGNVSNAIRWTTAAFKVSRDKEFEVASLELRIGSAQKALTRPLG